MGCIHSGYQIYKQRIPKVPGVENSSFIHFSGFQKHRENMFLKSVLVSIVHITKDF